jgi:DNA adenine methylase
MTPTRPALRWHGGKWLLADWIIGFFPEHRVYVEPFGGAASVLLQKPRAYAEVYNELDDEVVNFFAVVRGERSARRLRRALELTPFSRCEFRNAYRRTKDPVERARRLVIRAFMGFGSNAHASQANGHRSTGFRGNSNRSGTTPAHDWASYPAALDLIIARMRGVVIENRDAMRVMRTYDRADTLFYLDPPYLPDLRSPSGKADVRWRMYRHEMTEADHVRLLAFVCQLKGMVVLSGYPSALYDKHLPGWHCFKKKAFADGARPRIEAVWINKACQDAQLLLFARAG